MRKTLGIPSVFSTGDASELRRILKGLQGLIEERNRYIHAAWSYYDEKSKIAHGTRARRSGPEDIVASIEHIEGLADSFAEENDILLEIIFPPYCKLIQWTS
jgi:hypothetical protein